MPDGPRLIFAARRAPYPLDNGSRIRSNRLLTGLSSAFETTLVTFEHRPGSPDGHCGREQLEELFPGVEVVTVPGLGPGKRGPQLRSLLSSRSFEVGRYRLPAFGDALSRLVEQRRPPLVHFDDIGVGQFAPIDAGISVLSTHNVDYRIAQEGARASSGPRRLYGEIEWRKLHREELGMWRRVPLCLAVSELDAETMRAAGARRVELCPNGTDPVDRLAVGARASDEPLRLLFVGSGAFAPYERGLAWLVREVLPRLRETMPVAFDVVGQPPRRPLAAPGVEYVGRVPSVAPWYERAHVVVVPVFEGSGTRLKIIEAMAYGRPVVSTRLGAEGLPVQPGGHYLQADEPGDFARALIEAAGWYEAPADRLEHRLRAARAAIEHLFWPSIAQRLVDLYTREIARGGGFR